MRSYKNLLWQGKHEWGDKFDPSALAQKFVRFYESGQRIEVKFSPDSEPERGYVGCTTGWKPSFLLIHRRSDLGSSTLLSDHYEVIKTLPLWL